MRWALATAAVALLGWLAVEEMVVVVMVIDSSRGQGQAVFQRGRSNGRRCCAACCCHCSCVDGLHGRSIQRAPGQPPTPTSPPRARRGLLCRAMQGDKSVTARPQQRQCWALRLGGVGGGALLRRGRGSSRRVNLPTPPSRPPRACTGGHNSVQADDMTWRRPGAQYVPAILLLAGVRPESAACGPGGRACLLV